MFQKQGYIRLGQGLGCQFTPVVRHPKPPWVPGIFEGHIIEGNELLSPSAVQDRPKLTEPHSGRGGAYPPLEHERSPGLHLLDGGYLGEWERSTRFFCP